MKYVKKKTDSGKVVNLKNYKKRAKINKIKRKIFLVFFIFLMISLFFMYVPFMRVKQINCINNNKIASQEIIKASEFCIGNNIIRVNVGKAVKNIEKIPYIDKVKIKRKFPSTINIEVEEAQIFSYVISGSTYIYIDKNGCVLEKSTQPPKDPVPVIIGAKAIKHDVNDIIEFEEEGHLDALLKISSAITDSKFNGITTIINLSDLSKISISIKNTLTVLIGDVENIDYKINFLASGAYENIGDSASGTLDVSYGTKAIYKENK